jgi:hypothetical protein
LTGSSHVWAANARDEGFLVKALDEYSIAAFARVVVTVSFGSFQIRQLPVAVAISAAFIWSR